MSKYSNEFKLLVAQRYENEIISYRDLAKQSGIDESVIRYWVLLFQHHGDQAFNFPYTNYPAAFKLRVIQFMNETNYSIREASALFHIPDLSWNLTVGLFTTSGFTEFVYKTICFFILFFVVPLIWNGKTIGTNILRFKLTHVDGGVPRWQSLLKRFFALYFPFVTSWILNIFTGIELDINSSLYPYHVWITVIIFAFLIIMWTVLFIHTMVILIKRGKRNFYFDYVADLVPRKK